MATLLPHQNFLWSAGDWKQRGGRGGGGRGGGGLRLITNDLTTPTLWTFGFLTAVARGLSFHTSPDTSRLLAILHSLARTTGSLANLLLEWHRAPPHSQYILQMILFMPNIGDQHIHGYPHSPHENHAVIHCWIRSDLLAVHAHVLHVPRLHIHILDFHVRGCIKVQSSIITTQIKIKIHAPHCMRPQWC